jgi:putative transposase
VCAAPVGKWFVTFSCEVEPVALPAVETAVGIDVGLASFARMSDGSEIETPRFFRRDEKDLKRVHQLLKRK